MSHVNLLLRENVAILELSRGVTHPLNLPLLEELSAHLDRLSEDEAVDALVFTGAGEKFFSLGFDLPALVTDDRERFGRFYRAFNRVTVQLFTHAVPTVAAIRGHAVAGGCILALACDRRVIAEGRTLMGLNEIKLGVPIPFPGDCLLRSIVSPGIARTIVESGDFHDSAKLLRMGLVDEIVPRSDVLDRSIEAAREHGAFPRDAARLIKRSRTERIEREVATEIEERERVFLDTWFSDDTRPRLVEAAKKF